MRPTYLIKNSLAFRIFIFHLEPLSFIDTCRAAILEAKSVSLLTFFVSYFQARWSSMS